MEHIETDVVVIGAGTAGMNARREVEKAGQRWLLVEEGSYGTTCARVGCMPSKLLVAAADAAHRAREAGRFGVRVDGVRVDGPAVLERVRAERDRFVGFVVRDVERLPTEQRLRGRARLTSPTTLEVDGRVRVEARAIVIATGSSPVVLPTLAPVRDRVLLNDDVFELPDLPESVAVIGAGVIGLELGQALHRLGVHVEVFDLADTVLGLEDPAVRDAANRAFADELPLHLGCGPESFEPVDDGVRVHWTHAGQPRSRVFRYILCAVGRRPNVDDMGLEALGVPLSRRGVPASDPFTTQVGDLPVFIAGDVAGYRALLHEASDEGRIAGANAARWPQLTHGDRRTPLSIAFTDPQLAVVGPRWSQLDHACTAVGEASFENQGRARVIGRNRGLVRVYGDRRTTRLVGGVVFGPEAEHLGHLLAWAVADQLTVPEALERPFYHPVLEEGLRTALRGLARELKVASRCSPEAFSTGPGQ